MRCMCTGSIAANDPAMTIRPGNARRSTRCFCRHNSVCNSAKAKPPPQQLSETLGGMRLAPPIADHRISYQVPAETPSARATQMPLPRSRAFQWLHSFSALTRYAAAAVVIDDSGAADESGADSSDADEDLSIAAVSIEVAEDSRLLALYPLRGPRFGD